MAEQLLSTAVHETMPGKYVRPESQRPRLAEVVADARIPVVDLASPDRAAVVSAIGAACRSHGFFQRPANTMNSPGCWMTTMAFCIIIIAATGLVTPGGHAPLVSFLGVLAGVNLVTVGVWMHEHDSREGWGALTKHLRQNLAVVGFVIAALAITTLVAVGTASPALCFGLFVLLLLGICLVMLRVLDS